MSLETGKNVLDQLKIGDRRDSGSLVESGKVLHLADDDFDSNAYYLYPWNQCVRVTIASAGDNVVYLPSVREAAGKLYSIAGVSIATGTLAVADLGDDAAFSNESITDGLFTLWYSDGYKWFLITAATA
jgi:hypothetical protein